MEIRLQEISKFCAISNRFRLGFAATASTILLSRILKRRGSQGLVPLPSVGPVGRPMGFDEIFTNQFSVLKVRLIGSPLKGCEPLSPDLGRGVMSPFEPYVSPDPQIVPEDHHLHPTMPLGGGTSYSDVLGPRRWRH